MSYNPCGNDILCQAGQNIANFMGVKAPTPKPAPPKPTPRLQETVPVRNNKPLTSRFQGVNPQTFNKPGAGVGATIAANPVVKAISSNPTVQKIQDQFNLPEWAIPAGITGVVVLIVILLVSRR